MDYLKSVFMGFVYAFRGLIHILRHETNARIHLLIALTALVLGWALDVSNTEAAAIFFAILIVFLAEIINTAIEKTLDLIDTKPNSQIALIKDMAAGAVLVASIGAAIIGSVIFVPYIIDLLWR